MSRSRRRESKRSPQDWVLTGNVWTEFDDNVAINSAVMLPLTQQGPMVDPLMRAVPQVEQSVVAVRGQIFLWPDAPIPANTRGSLDARISVKEGDAVGVPQVPTGYDLTAPAWADEQFLWHRTHWFVSGGTWLEPEKRQVMKDFDVNVKVRRRLEANQLLALTMQWSQTAQGDPTVSLRYLVRLRTLVKYMT